jgi:serine/threonine-protein kinase
MPFHEEPDFDQAVLTKSLPIDCEEIPPELQTILSRATAKRATDRYPSAREFREAVEKALGPIASNEELAAHLEGYFPVGDPTRAERRRLLDAGIADWAKRLWEIQAEQAQQAGVDPPPPPRGSGLLTPITVPPSVAANSVAGTPDVSASPPAVQTPPPAPATNAPVARSPVPTPPAASVRPAAPAKRPVPRVLEDEVSIVAGAPLKERSPRWPLVFAGGLAVGAGLLFLGRMFFPGPAPVAPPVAAPVAQAPTPAPVVATAPAPAPAQAAQPAAADPGAAAAAQPTVAKAEAPEPVAPKHPQTAVSSKHSNPELTHERSRLAVVYRFGSSPNSPSTRAPSTTPSPGRER